MPCHEKVPSHEKVSSHEKVPSHEKMPSHEKVPSQNLGIGLCLLIGLPQFLILSSVFCAPSSVTIQSLTIYSGSRNPNFQEELW